MSKEQFTPQSNHSSEIDKPTPSARVLMALEGGELRAKIKDLELANRQAESEIKRHPLRLAAVFVLGGGSYCYYSRLAWNDKTHGEQSKSCF